MCTWMTELPTRTKTGELEKKPNLMIWIKPTELKEYYRFRLLGFKSAKSERDFPFIVRFTHQKWTEDSDGKRRIESVVCPVTPFIKAKWKGDPMDDCPICKFANVNFIAWKQSDWKDKESAKKNKDFGRKFEALIPVYVINDPVYPTNNGHFKVFSFTDKEQYKKFLELIQEKSRESVVFNGKNALDFYIRYEMIEETLHEGQPNEFVWKHPVLKQMGFTNKPYDIPQITKEAIDQFQFDEQYFVGSTMSELQDFYNRFVKVSNDDIPDEEEINFVQQTEKKTIVENTNSVKNTTIVETKQDTKTFEEDIKVNEQEINDLLNKKDEVIEEKPSVAEKKNEILESPKDPLKTETDEKDIESLLDDIL